MMFVDLDRRIEGARLRWWLLLLLGLAALLSSN